MKIRCEKLVAHSKSMTLSVDNWTIFSGQSWAIFSADGDIGTLLAQLLCETAQPVSGHLAKHLSDAAMNNPSPIALVSLAEQQSLLEHEIRTDNSDFLETDDPGTRIYDLVYRACCDDQKTQTLLAQLDLTHLKNHGFRTLSTGETRRLMLARAVAAEPELLILDEPYVGLDINHRQKLMTYLAELSQTIQMLVIVSREEDMPQWITRVALFNQGQMVDEMEKSEWDKHPIITQISAQSKLQSEQMLTLIRSHRHQVKMANPIFQITNGKVAYTDKTIFSQVNWRIDQGEHWQVIGPNGCGKSTLLGLIFGDHPQCYSNDIDIFGRKRGSGETIWEIKQHIGMVSSGLHLQYRVNCSALDVIVSGFYDSIGLYQQPTKQEFAVAQEWLTMLHMEQLAKVSFRQLEYGQQRLLIIARAIVKQPALLILDEPYQGLDFLGRRLVKNTLEMIARENLSQLLYVSHYQSDSLEEIKNFVEFIPNEHGEGYLTKLTRRLDA